MVGLSIGTGIPFQFLVELDEKVLNTYFDILDDEDTKQKQEAARQRMRGGTNG